MSKEELSRLYRSWIVDETSNPNIDLDSGGARLALNLLVELDPYEYAPVKSESIGGDLSQTFAVDESGIPLKIYKWLKPYYKVSTI